MAYDNTDGRLRGRKLQAARLRIWAASGGLCARCRRLTAYPDGFELDHIAARHKGGGNDDENLQVLCVERTPDGIKSGCHIKKTAIDCGYAERAQFDASGRVIW